MKQQLFALTFFSAALLGAASFDDVFSQGIRDIRKGNREAALSAFQQASELAKTPAQKTQAMLQISLAMPDGDAAKALQMLVDFRKSVGELPRQCEAWLELRIGVLQNQQKQYAEAVKSLGCAISLKKLGERDLQLAYDKLSNAQLHLGKYQDSLNTLEQWEKLDNLSARDYVQLLTRRTGLLGVLKRFSEAYECGETAAGMDGVPAMYRALAWQMLSHVAFANEKNYSKALEYSNKSKAANNGKSGFNAKLHAQILKACENRK